MIFDNGILVIKGTGVLGTIVDTDLSVFNAKEMRIHLPSEHQLGN